MEYKVISADTHLDTAWLPGDLFTDNAPAHLRDKMPYVTEGKHGGKVWEIGGEYMCGAGVGGNPHPGLCRLRPRPVPPP